MNYKNLLENKYNIQKIIYLLEFEKDLLEAELVSIELGDNNDFNRLERYLQLSTIYRFCENQIQALKKQESESETKMYQDLYMQQNGNNYSDKEWWGIVLWFYIKKIYKKICLWKIQEKNNIFIKPKIKKYIIRKWGDIIVFYYLYYVRNIEIWHWFLKKIFEK